MYNMKDMSVLFLWPLLELVLLPAILPRLSSDDQYGLSLLLILLSIITYISM